MYSEQGLLALIGAVFGHVRIGPDAEAAVVPLIEAASSDDPQLGNGALQALGDQLLVK